MLQSLGSQRIGHDWVTAQQQRPLQLCSPGDSEALRNSALALVQNIHETAALLYALLG